MAEYKNLRNRAEWNQVILRQLLDFEAICAAHGIRWFLESGTLLGAVRHRGFIPWDNDIDVALLDEDYRKLCQIFATEGFPGGYILEDNDLNPNYPSDIGRFIDPSMTCLLRTTEFADTPPGVQFDVFRYVGVPDDPQEREAAVLLCNVLGELMHPYRRRCGHRPEAFWPRYHQAVQDMEQLGREAVLQQLKQEFAAVTAVPDSEWLLLVSAGTYNAYPLQRREWYLSKPRRLSFEGHQLPVPSDPLRVLRQLYGESFRCYPPGEKWHSYRASGNVPAAVMHEDYCGVLDKEQVHRELTAAKEAAMLQAEMRPPYSRPVYLMQAYKELAHFVEALDGRAGDYADVAWELLQSERTPAPTPELLSLTGADSPVADAARAYLQTVLASKYGEWQIQVVLDGELLLLLCCLLLLEWHPFWDALKLLERSQEATEPDLRLEKLYCACTQASELLLAMDEQRLGDVDDILVGLEYWFPCLREVAYGRMWLAARASASGLSHRQLSAQQAAELAQLGAADGELQCYYADYLAAAGRQREALNIYRTAADKTNNGCVRLHIQDCLAEAEA
ncbi:MAG: LicD family protein [Coriobacteriales bacterium]|nr:LicD family protein [Coriobacteriales bacterium]